MKVAYLLIALLLLVVVSGCMSSGNLNVEGNDTVSDEEVQGALGDFETSLMNETDDVEIGSLL